MNFLVGLTGGIGSGKTTVADIFTSFGVTIVDTDAIAHELTGPRGGAMEAIAEAFGPGVLLPQGGLDRTAMRRVAFSDPEAKRRLEGILHPLIRSETERRCVAMAWAPYVMLVVPLLVESGVYRQRVDRVLVVDCNESTQVERVIARSGLTAEEVRAIMATQASREERLAVADDVILNEGDRAELEDRILPLHRRYLELAEVAGRHLTQR